MKRYLRQDLGNPLQQPEEQVEFLTNGGAAIIWEVTQDIQPTTAVSFNYDLLCHLNEVLLLNILISVQ